MDRLGTIIVAVLFTAVFGVVLVYGTPLFDNNESVGNSFMQEVLIAGVENGSFDQLSVGSPTILYDTSTQLYKMWYVGLSSFGKTAIGYAFSANGIEWSKSTDAPVLYADAPWEDGGLVSVHVVQEGSTYRMWYSARTLATEQTHIGYATSPDGIHWAKHGQNPVLRAETSEVWRSQGVSDPTVHFYNGLYRMWFTGTRIENKEEMSAIGYATSTNGTTWTLHENNPVLGDTEGWSPHGMKSPAVMRSANGQLFTMWFAGIDKKGTARIGRAFSNDGVVWAEDSLNPLIGDDGSSVSDPVAYSVNDIFYLWMHRSNKREGTITFTTYPLSERDGQPLLPTFVPTGGQF